jgi:lysyl-tRNA synthetase class 2
MPHASSWWHPDRHADRRPFLLARNRIATACRNYFAERGFVEADPSILQASPGNEAHLHAFGAELQNPDGSPRARAYLHTSPEFALKKLLAAGEERLFAFAHAFRNRERGPLHHPEFTLLEWYRAGQPYEALTTDCAELLELAAKTAGTCALSWGDGRADPSAPLARLTLAQAFERFAGIDLLASVAPDGATDRDALADAAVAADDTWSDLFSRVLVERIEPRLGQERATILDEYPVSQAALARPKPADPRVAERFELYACGVVLANGMGELTDPAEQRRRVEAEMAEKERVYGERYPLDEDFLEALALMPPASGIALGFDRLVMLATGARRIEQVLWAPCGG